MPMEIERKFLVTSDAWRHDVTRVIDIRQAYLAVTARNSVRVRLADDKAYLTVKSAVAAMARDEFEFAIPFAQAEAMLALRTSGLIEKRRHIVPQGTLNWEVDVFAGDLDGLVIAEIELPAETTPVALPAWVGAEITSDRRYSNAQLATEGRP